MFGALAIAQGLFGVTGPILIITGLAIRVFDKNEDRIISFVFHRLKSDGMRRILKFPFFGTVMSVIFITIIVFLCSVSAVNTYVQPQAFIGWTQGSGLAFGREVAAISKHNYAGNEFCGQVHVWGKIKNTLDKPIQIAPKGNPDISSKNPSVSFSDYVSLEGFNGNVNLQPGDTMPVGVTGLTDIGDCQGWSQDNLNNLVGSRITVIGSLYITIDGGPVTTTSYTFDDLPVIGRTD